MVVRLYSVYDRVAESYSDVQAAVNDGVALRMFKTFMKEHPEFSTDDYVIRCVGSFDNSKGILRPLAMPSELVPGQLELLAEKAGE